MKKILVLGGSDIQIPLVKKIKELGYYVITCDYLPDNPAHKLSDEFYNVSVIDENELLDLCNKLKIDAIIPYTSEAAVITSSKVCEKLKLPTNTQNSSEIMTNKNLFREFLEKNNFKVPKYRVSNEYEIILNFVNELKRDCVIKPVDSCGSKGVFKVSYGENFRNKFDKSISYSREGNIIIEEFIKRKGYQIGGDGFVRNGILEFRCFGDLHFSKNNPFLPCSVSVPSTQPKFILEKVHSTIQELLNKVGLRMGGLNFDIIIDENNDVYLIEIAARSGGNMIPELTKYCTDIDIKEFVILSSLGEDFKIPSKIYEKKYFSHYVIHSNKSGRLKKIEISEKLKKCILEYHMNYYEGDFVEEYINSTKRLGLMLLKYENLNEMYEIIENFDKHYKLTFYDE